MNGAVGFSPDDARGHSKVIPHFIYIYPYDLLTSSFKYYSSVIQTIHVLFLRGQYKLSKCFPRCKLPNVKIGVLSNVIVT